MQLVRDYSAGEFHNNVILLAKLGKVFKLLAVLTTSLGQSPNGPFIPGVVSMFPDVPVIDRPGIISAWDDPQLVASIEKIWPASKLTYASPSSPRVTPTNWTAVAAELQRDWRQPTG